MPDSLLALLRRSRTGRRDAVAARTNAGPASGPGTGPDAPPAEARARACGWFDSSHELRQGLVVDESPDAAALAQAPLEAWLAWELSAWQAALAAEPVHQRPPEQA